MTDERDYGSLDAVPIAELRREITERKRIEDRLLRRTHQLEVLLGMSRRLNEVLEIPVVLRSLVSAAMEITGATSGAAGLLEDGDMVFTEYNEHGRLLPVQYEFPPGYGVPGWVAQTKRPYISNDPEHDPHVVPEIREALDFRNLVDVPILGRSDELLGCFEIHNKIEGTEPFDERDVEMLRSLAASAAVALENARAVEERRSVEEALKEAESKYRSLVEESLVGVYIIQDGRLIYANPRLAEIFGYTVHEITGMEAIETVAPEDRALVRGNIRKRLEGKTKSMHYSFRGLCKDGAIVYVEVYGSRMIYHGQPAVIGSMLDVTARKRVELSLARLAAIVKATSDYAAVGTIDGQLLYMNKAGREMVGLGPDEDITGRKVLDFHPPWSARIVLQEGIPTALKNGVWRGETALIGKGGRIIPTSQVILSFKQPDTDETYIATIMRDISTQKRAQEDLRRFAVRFKAIFDAAPAAIMIYDENAVVQQVNPAFEAISGFSKDQVEGKSMYDTFADIEQKPRLDAIIQRIQAGETVSNVEWEPRRPDGSTYYIIVTTTPLMGEHGVEAILALGVDITDRKMAEQRRDELDAHKREFYRRTIEAATEGKLVITERSDICGMAGDPIASWNLTSGEQLGAIRSEIADIAKTFGMQEDRVFDFVLIIGEATTNAIKHANGGSVSLHRLDDSLMLVVADRGSGIEALALPELALKKGYTTAVSLGMGYKEMISIADKVYLATSPGGTTVALEMARQKRQECPLGAVLPDMW